MICRLCLKSLNGETPVFLFDTSENFAETGLLKMIAKYIYLELSQDDPISTTICQECCEHLENFHTFWLHVDQKQNTLRNEFHEVHCDVQLSTPTTAENDDNEELLLDMKYIPMGFTEPDLEDNAQSEFPCAKSDADSMDDDVPLLTLLNKQKSSTMRKMRKRSSKQKKNSKAKCDDVIDEDLHGKKVSEKNKKTSSNMELAKRNQETINNFMTLSCDLCNCPAETYEELRIHFQTVHQRSAYVKCCGSSYTRPAKLLQHIRFHQNPDLYKCDICQKRYRSEKSLKVHNETHLTSEEFNLSCRICNKTFLSQKCLRNHVLKHNSDEDHNCEICNKSFFTAQRLRAHINSIHENIIAHICDTCGKKFKCKTSFKKHLLEHQGIVEPPAQCDVCFEWLKNKHSLRLHRFKHDSNDFECQICHRKCPSRAALYKHNTDVHRRPKSLQCKYCEKSFKQRQSLEEHVATHTGAQLYTCPHCAREYRSKANMYVHIKRIHVEEWIKAKIARSHDPNLKSALDECLQ